MQYNTLINISYPILMLELQQAILDGWVIDENNLPAHYPMQYFEVHIVRDEHRAAVKEVFGEDSATLDFSKITVKPEAQAVKRGPKPKN
jgi:hypothetical protein